MIKERPDAILVNEGANTLDFARSIIDMYEPRKRLDVGTWGVMGIGMGFAVGAAVETGKPVLAVEGDSAFGFSGMEVETICRYRLPVCVVVMNNNGVYAGTDKNLSGGADVAPTVFVKDARYEMMMQAFGGKGYYATTPEQLRAAMTEALASGRPSLINASLLLLGATPGRNAHTRAERVDRIAVAPECLKVGARGAAKNRASHRSVEKKPPHSVPRPANRSLFALCSPHFALRYFPAFGFGTLISKTCPDSVTSIISGVVVATVHSLGIFFVSLPPSSQITITLCLPSTNPSAYL